MRTYFEFVSRTPVLAAMLGATAVLLGAVFPALPIGGELLDVKPGYSYAEAVATLEGYGAPGRRVYAWASVTLDTVLPVVYVSFLAGLVYRCRPRAHLGGLAYLPIAAGMLDVGENVQIVYLLLSYPAISAGQVASASAFTVAKTAAVVLSLGLAGSLWATAVARWAWRRGRGRTP